MKKGLIIFVLILTIGNVFGQITGKYKSTDYNLFERGLLYLKGVDSFIGGMDLTLKSDSSFIMKTCSVLDTGKWFLDNDSLILEVFTRKSRSDSINNALIKPEWLKGPYRSMTYKIIDNGFYREIYLKGEENKKIKAADKLIRNNLP